MDFHEVENVFNPHLSSTMVMYAVRPTTIWTLRSDSSICVFKRSNPKVFSKFPFDGHDPLTAKISVDSLGEKCVIFWDRLPILFFSLATGIVTTIPNITSIFHPTSACWLSIPGQVPVILVGSLVGEVMMISSDEEHESTYLYILADQLPIREMYAYAESDTKMVFLLVEEQVYTFISQEPLQLIFKKGPSNKVLILGETQANVDVDHRLSLDTFDGPLRLSAIHQLGVISFKAEQRANGSISFQQTVTEVGIQDTKSFEICPWGLLIVFDKNILLLSQSKPKASLPVHNVRHISCDAGGLVLFTDEEIKIVSLKALRTYLVHTAIKQKDFAYALYVAQDDPIKNLVLQKQIAKMSLSKVGPYVHSLNWPLNEVASALQLDSKPMLFYLRELLKSVCQKRNKQKSVIINWAFHLHSCFYPDLEKEFIEFLEQYGKELFSESTYNRLNAIRFEKGIQVLAEVNNDTQKIIDCMLLNSDYVAIFKYITELNIPSIISETLVRLLRPKFKEVHDFIVNNPLKLPFKEGFPILAHTPDISYHIVNETSHDPSSIALLIISLCISHQNERIMQLILSHNMDLGFIYRFAYTFDCFAAVARILVRMNQPKLAVRFAMKVGLGYTNTLLTQIHDTTMQKEAWVELLHVVSPEEREKALTRIMLSHLFTFEELIDVIGDDAFLFEYSDEMLGAVTELEKDAEISHYRVIFSEVRPADFPLSYEEGCYHCQLPLLGTKFTAFPCGHMMHKTCLNSLVQTIQEKHCDENINPLDSCPICGIISVETALQSFQVH